MSPHSEKNSNGQRGPLLVLKNALEGCHYAFTTQKNFIAHFSISFLVVLFGFWLKISLERFVILLFAITFGLAIEMANTTLESTIDLITKEWHLEAKRAKDVAAGTMLIVSIGLAIIGFLILLPPFLQKFF